MGARITIGAARWRALTGAARTPPKPEAEILRVWVYSPRTSPYISLTHTRKYAIKRLFFATYRTRRRAIEAEGLCRMSMCVDAATNPLPNYAPGPAHGQQKATYLWA